MNVTAFKGTRLLRSRVSANSSGVSVGRVEFFFAVSRLNPIIRRRPSFFFAGNRQRFRRDVFLLRCQANSLCEVCSPKYQLDRAVYAIQTEVETGIITQREHTSSDVTLIKTTVLLSHSSSPRKVIRENVRSQFYLCGFAIGSRLPAQALTKGLKRGARNSLGPAGDHRIGVNVAATPTLSPRRARPRRHLHKMHAKHG